MVSSLFFLSFAMTIAGEARRKPFNDALSLSTTDIVQVFQASTGHLSNSEHTPLYDIYRVQENRNIVVLHPSETPLSPIWQGIEAKFIEEPNKEWIFTELYTTPSGIRILNKEGCALVVVDSLLGRHETKENQVKVITFLCEERGIEEDILAGERLEHEVGVRNILRFKHQFVHDGKRTAGIPLYLLYSEAKHLSEETLIQCVYYYQSKLGNLHDDSETSLKSLGTVGWLNTSRGPVGRFFYNTFV